MARPKYELEDAEAMHREAPKNFSIPRKVVRENLPVGAFVKLIFQAPGDRRERMWVEVTEADSGKYVGLLRNDPHLLKKIAYDAVTHFSAEHVAARHDPTPNPSSPTPDQIVRVERKGWDKCQLPRYLFRKKPTKKFSGWYLFSSPAPEKFPGELDFVDVPVDFAIQVYPILESVLDESTGNLWKWSTKDLEYVEVKPVAKKIATKPTKKK